VLPAVLWLRYRVASAANENITIQNNTIRQNANEGILFHYSSRHCH
jgi:hypothetical protein